MKRSGKQTLRIVVLATLAAAAAAWLAPPMHAVDRDREGAGEQRPAARQRDRGRAIPRGAEAKGGRQATEEGLPADMAERFRLHRRRWTLGVRAYNTPTGVVVTYVMPRSPAWNAGLEPDDVIVTVDGYQIGHVDNQLYPLGEELQHRADSRGRVRLLVQNCRNNELLNLDVALRRGLWPQPRRRGAEAEGDDS
jgi:hypothetical protein